MKIKYNEKELSAKELEALQDKAVKSVNASRVQVQVALVATILHIGKHGDWTVAQRFVERLGNSVNSPAIVDWLKQYGHLTVNDDGFTGFTEKNFRNSILSTLDDAKKDFWWSHKVQAPFKGYSAEAALQQFIKTHNAQVKKLTERTPEERAKVSLAVNDATIRQVLALCHFDSIIADAGNTDKIADEINGLEKAIAADSQ